MGRLITASINLSKVDEGKLYESKKGEKWLNLTIWQNDKTDEYGNDFAIAQTTAKDEPKNYLGNGKYYKKPDDEPPY